MEAPHNPTTPLRPADWPERLSPAFYTGLDEFNTRQYYQCHETLETLWLADKGSVRQLYQGVLQIAVGCFHLIERQNWRGAVNKLDAGARRLEATGVQEIFDDEIGVYGVDWLAVIADADRLQQHLRELGEANINLVVFSFLPQIQHITPKHA